MRYQVYLLKGDQVEIVKTEDLEQFDFRLELGKMWFSATPTPELYIYDSRFNFWQQARVTHQDKISTMGVVREEYIPPLVRMHQLIG